MSIKDIKIQEPKKVRSKKTQLTVAKSDIVEQPKNPQQIAELLRASGGLFDTLDYDVYRLRLDNFSMNELTNEAFRVGLKGGQDRFNTTRGILEVFQDYRNKFMPSIMGISAKDGMSEEKRALALSLMKDGR